LRAEYVLADGIDLLAGYQTESRDQDGAALIETLFTNTVSFGGVNFGELQQIVDSHNAIERDEDVADIGVQFSRLGPFSVRMTYSQTSQDITATPDVSEIVIDEPYGGQGGKFSRQIDTFDIGGSFVMAGFTLSAQYRDDSADDAVFRTDYLGNPVNEFGGMAEALTDLYQLAAKQGDANAGRHLKLAAVFNRDWFIEPLLQGQDKLSGLHGNTHVAQACGLARYALATGDARTGKAAETFWKLLVNEHSFAIGGNSFDEKLRAARTEVAGNGDAALSPKTAETCNTHNVLKLSRHLFQREPRADYADYCELALYNHILATIAPDSGHVTYFTPLRPGDFRTYLDAPFCCQGTGIENTARFGEAIYFHHADTLWVNLFIPSTLDWRERRLKLRLETMYPETGFIRCGFEAAAPTNATILLRIPSWVIGPVDLAINGKRESTDARPGTFLPITRRWQAGDVIELRLPLGLRVRPSMDDPTTVSLFYGPVILASELGRDTMPASDIAGKDAFVKAPAWPVPVFISATPGQPSLPVQPLPDAPLRFEAGMFDPVNRRDVRVRLAPLHRVHHQRFAVYWKVVAPERN
jgi:hypothetical protein